MTVPNIVSPMTTRESFVRRIEDALGKRKLYWFGPRGADGRTLLELDQFDGAFSLMAPLEAVTVKFDTSLETLTGERVEHNTYSLEADESEAVLEFRSRLLSALSQPSAVVPYRSSRFLSNICFPRAGTALHLGQFYEHQSQFEHKPWVESELKRVGVSVLPWRYFADEDRPRALEYLARCGSIVLRASKSDGGARVELIRSEEEFYRHIPQHDDGFLSACEFFEDALALNLNGCIFSDGQCVLQGLSEQLIGRPELVSRRFGYCGNRFRSAGSWPAGLVEQFEQNARLCAKWLQSQGYRGVFGLDALFADGKIYIVEINPRFQGSTWAAADIDRSLGRPDLYLCQVAVELGLEAPRLPPLADGADQLDSRTMMIAHNLETGPVVTNGTQPELMDAGWLVDLVPRPNISIAPSAILARLLTRSASTLTKRNIYKNLSALPTIRKQDELFG